MKKIEAIIRKTKFEEVKEALLSSDIDWFEYCPVHGIGQSRQERIYRDRAHEDFYRMPRNACTAYGRCHQACSPHW